MRLDWILLILAGLLEIVWAIGLKYTAGFTRPLPTMGTVSAMIISMYLLGKASQTLPIGTAYGVWVGIGTVGASILGIVLLGESASLSRICFLILLVIAIVGLKITSA